MKVSEGEEARGGEIRAREVDSGEAVMVVRGREARISEGDILTSGSRKYRLVDSSNSTATIQVARYFEESFRVGLIVDYLDTVEETDEKNNRIDRVYQIGGEKSFSGNVKMRLEEGWNMISSPRKRGFPLKEVRDECQLSAYKGEKSWSFRGEWAHPRSVNARRGTYVYSAADCTAVIEDFEGESKDTADLEKGWNMISVPESKTLNQLSTDCNFRKYKDRTLWHYSPEKAWQKMDSSQTLNPSKSYFVNVEKSCRIKYGETDISEPPTPQ